MREIKYRQWNRALKCWHYWGFLEDGSFTGLTSLHEISYQYTSFKDKNRNEIYEGDIDEDSDKVEFSEGCWWLGDEPLVNFHPGNINIVGNVHENPDLLKE